jgi:acyl-[acyl-carrier-protein]-phospholipid O-acyltransferase/long-chain-fatty-acid--[acyl-carrier-protein] ligase
LERLLTVMKASDMPNLWVPKASAFYRIEEIPILGTGKMDIKSIKKTALGLDLGE